MTTVIMSLCLYAVNPPSPFYDANFVALSSGSASVFANPAGVSLQNSPELMGEFHIDTLRTAVSLRSLGFGIVKLDTAIHYEVDAGMKLPGAFALGYSYLFHDTSCHAIGLICALSQNLQLGYRTNLGEVKTMTGSLTVKPYQELLLLSCDASYEGIQDTSWFYFGGALCTTQGSKIYFCSDVDMHWHAGIDIVLDRLRLAGAYTSINKRFCAGVVLYASSM